MGRLRGVSDSATRTIRKIKAAVCLSFDLSGLFAGLDLERMPLGELTEHAGSSRTTAVRGEVPSVLPLE
jgi:hypothetical protein